MKTLLKAKTIIASAVIATLTGCGSESYSPAEKENLYAPEHGGDISLTLSEKEEFGFVYALGALDGRAGGEGVATDMDGDILLVRNMTMTPADAVGVEISGGTIGLRASEVAPLIDTGETYTVELSYDVSDGTNATPRNMTITFVGEDAAPEFETPFTSVFTKFEDVQSIDLLSGVTDADEEPLSISDVVISASADNVAGAATVTDNMVTVDIPSIADLIPLGTKAVFTVTYNVEDHNNSLPRTANIEVRGVTLDPLPPIVDGVKTVSANTSGTRVVVNLAAEPEILEPNGEDVIADLTTITPVGDAPAFEFAASMDNELIFDPVVFSAHVASAETKTFTYTYMVNDGEPLNNVEATIEITITNDGAENVMPNGGFEDGLSGWSPAGIGLVSAVSSSALGLDFEGSQLAAFSAEETLSTSLGDLELGATYVLESRAKHADGWGGGSTASVTGTLLEDDGSGVIVEVPNSPITSNNWYEHGGGNRTNAVSFTAVDAMSVAVNVAQAVDMDDFRLYKVAFEQANNLISEADSTFNEGAGNWTLSDSASVSDTDAISGAMSLHSGKGGDKRNILALADGTLKDGKRYLVTMDVEIDEYSAANHPLRVSVVDPSNTDVTVIGHAFKGVYFLNQATQTFTAVLDLPRDSEHSDWSTRAQELHVGTNVWGPGFNYRIDNVRIIEIP
ncbi:hypothetical protein [Thalassotalea sp. PLHSN55]|uniref:hypothetical protein n=1 Tax=Thalassotalea sp. PLHSN55 TaxID=3435888 RepID=UPI003F87A76C